MVDDRLVGSEAFGLQRARFALFDPRHARAYHNRGLAHAALGRNQEALVDYARALAIDPGYVRAYQNRLRVLEQLGDLRAMAADYARLAALDRANAADYLYRRGSALHSTIVARAFLSRCIRITAPRSSSVSTSPLKTTTDSVSLAGLRTRSSETFWPPRSVAGASAD